MGTTSTMHTESSELFTAAQSVIPGGVNSPVRAFKGVGGTPVFIDHSEGPYIFDTNGKRYIDYIGSWGPMILGHGHPSVIRALVTQLARGVSYGAATADEIKLAKLITQLVPSIEQVRLVNSGTEATMSAIRLARAFTERNKIIKFEGCYHGHSDGLLVKAGSGALTCGHPSSPGIPAATTEHTLIATYNDLDSVKKLFEQYPNDIATIIVEPIAGNMNLILPVPGFLEGLRKLCDEYHAVLIFDEVMTGFRVHLGGAQAYYSIKPDLTTLGKIIGGGLPVGAFGGRREIMSLLAPEGPVYQAGTLSGNPLAVAAGLATLEGIQAPGFYTRLTNYTESLCQGISAHALESETPVVATSIGGMFGFYFTHSHEAPTSYDAVMKCDAELFRRFFHAALNQGIYFAPSMYEAGFTSSAHDAEILKDTLHAVSLSFHQLKMHP